MDKENIPLINSLQQIGKDLRTFIEMSLQEPDESWRKWLVSIIRDLKTKCWEKKNCNKTDCPAYMNTCGRCWLIAGTMCGGDVQGIFALKYRSCTECEVYQEAVFSDPVAEVYEHVITLVHSLRMKQDELKTLATRDLLTGLYNRNYFDLVMVKEVERVNRYSGSLLLMLIDVDNFKKINDMYGHLHGDGVLKECAIILNKAVRNSDTVIRWGGDEFLIIMPETDCRETDAIIRRIQDCIAEWNAEYASSDYRLSFSIGCAALEKGKGLAEVLEEADRLMYIDKLSKR